MKSPTVRLLAGLAFAMLVISGYAFYTLRSVWQMREMQNSTIDRNRRASLQLLRIQNELNSLGLAMRDMLDNAGRYPLEAWGPPLARLRLSLDDAIAREAALAQPHRSLQQTAFLTASFGQFWRAADEALALAGRGEQARALELVRHTLQPKQEALSAMTARLLVNNYDQDSKAAEQVTAIYAQIERNAYWLLGLSLALIGITGGGLIHSNRRLFARLSQLAEQRSELARQLISTQESTFRAISHDLHDEFGQILTALGAMLRRAQLQAPDSRFAAQTQEASEVVQETLVKIRSLSQSLQPVILEEQGLAAAIEWHVAGFERQTGIAVQYRPPARSFELPEAKAIHVFRILQESLNNVARHAEVDAVQVAMEVTGTQLRLTVEDRGVGLSVASRPGVGLAAMRERAALIGGVLTVEAAAESPSPGTRVTLELPLEPATATQAIAEAHHG